MKEEAGTSIRVTFNRASGSPVPYLAKVSAPSFPPLSLPQNYLGASPRLRAPSNLIPNLR